VRYTLIVTVVVVGFYGFWYAATAGSSSGSPKLAEEWRADLSRFADPEDANVRDWRTFVIRFKSGEWVIARMQPSHGIWYTGGGTVVVKDSNGQMRAFFGHVCVASPNAIGHYEGKDLAQFYEYMASVFREHHFG